MKSSKALKESGAACGQDSLGFEEAAGRWKSLRMEGAVSARTSKT